jgi:hypothetical protein
MDVDDEGDEVDEAKGSSLGKEVDQLATLLGGSCQSCLLPQQAPAHWSHRRRSPFNSNWGGTNNSERHQNMKCQLTQ